MGKDLKISTLLDFYGGLLTEKQRNLAELYYNEDLSLGEIAEHEGITRQGVRDSIKRGENFLLELEDKLHMAENYKKSTTLLDGISKLAENIYRINDIHKYSGEIRENTVKIREYIKAYLEETS